MSDAKPRRAGRESPRSEIAAGEGVPPETAPLTIAPVALEAGQETSPTTVAAPVPPPPAAAPAGPVAEPVSRAAGESVEPLARADDAWAALAEMQAALARGFEEIAVEMTALTRSDIAAATDAATAMLDAHTFAEAVEISAGLIRRRADAMLEGSAKLSEIGAQAAAAASRPILVRLAAGWSGAGTG